MKNEDVAVKIDIDMDFDQTLNKLYEFFDVYSTSEYCDEVICGSDWSREYGRLVSIRDNDEYDLELWGYAGDFHPVRRIVNLSNLFTNIGGM